MNLLNTTEVAEKLNVTPIRVRQLIREGKLDATRIGRDYVIEESSLDAVQTYGKAGRPPKTENGNRKKSKSFAEVAAKYIGSIKDGLPTDLSSNKDYLKDLGKKSAEKKQSVKDE